MKTEKKIYCSVCEDVGELAGESCQACCDHQEHDHFVCLECGEELDPGSLIDAAEWRAGEER